RAVPRFLRRRRRVRAPQPSLADLGGAPAPRARAPARGASLRADDLLRSPLAEEPPAPAHEEAAQDDDDDGRGRGARAREDGRARGGADALRPRRGPPRRGDGEEGLAGPSL